MMLMWFAILPKLAQGVPTGVLESPADVRTRPADPRWLNQILDFTTSYKLGDAGLGAWKQSLSLTENICAHRIAAV